jgi:hypothetical protein
MPDRHHVAAILDNSRDELAEAITDRHYELHPELAERFGPAGRSHCREDAQYHLSYLSAAVAAGTPAFFTEYVGWCKAMLGARRIPADDLAENLGIAGTPIASIAVSTSRPEVIFVIASAALLASASTSVAASLRAGIDRDFC